MIQLFIQKKNMKKKSHPQVAFKWSRGDKVLLPALSGVVKNLRLTLYRYTLFLKEARKTLRFYGFFFNCAPFKAIFQNKQEKPTHYRILFVILWR